MPPHRAEPRCVLWHDPRAPLPQDLIKSLARRGLNYQTATDAFSAMALVCRRPAGRERDPVVLLLVEPSTLHRGAETIAALRRFAPRAVFWKYDRTAAPRLSALQDRELSPLSDRHTPVAKVANPESGSERKHVGSDTGVEQPPGEESGDGPKLRLAGAAPVLPGAEHREPPRPATQGPPGPRRTPETSENSDDRVPEPELPEDAGTRSLLTQEELTMLLADEVDLEKEFNGSGGSSRT